MELVVETLGDVLPHIVPETGIVHIQQDGYSVLNYVFTMDSTFDSQIARECRGLKFDPQGALIARPFHKFFNLGEKRPLEEEPWQTPHVILDKLDGSMVHPAYVRGEMVFMTRMGRSAQANAAFEVAGAGVIAFCTDMIARGYTPIFEYTAPDNRIVLAYENAELTLLAVRHMRSGVYMTQLQMTDAAAPYGVSTVASFGAVSDAPSFWADARALKGLEGYVIAFEDGHRVKIKADAYVLRHRALAGLEHEKNLLAWVATGALDDVLPLLSPDAAELVKVYSDQVLASVVHWEAEITGFVEQHMDLPRKEFAQKAKDALDPRLHPVAFKGLDGEAVHDQLMQLLERAAGSGTKVEGIRHIFGMKWKPPVDQ